MKDLIEIWKAVVGYEGLYEVSNLGNVRSLDRIVKTKIGDRRYKGKLLKGGIGTTGYYKVCLCHNKHIEVHRLVAEAFIPNPENKPQVDHINTIRTDNRVENLRWVSVKENHHNELTEQHKQVYYNKLTQEMKCKYIGGDNPMAKTTYQYTLDGTLVNVFDSAKTASIATGIRYQGICKSAHSEGILIYGGYKWRY